MESRKRGQTIRSEARTMVSRIIKKCDEEARIGRPLHLLAQATVRASEYTGVSVNTIIRIRKESLRSETDRLPSPGRKRPRCLEKKFHCSEEDRKVIRNIIYEYYIEKKTVPTGSKLLQTIQERINFPWRVTTLYRLLKSMGFQYKKSSLAGRKNRVLIEKPDIVQWRYKYLKAMQQYRAQNKNIIYIDETWIDNSLCKCWQSENKLRALQSKQSTHQLVIVHAGGKNGFMNGIDLIFKLQATPADKGKINVLDFEKWIIERLLPNVLPNSVIVISHALYYNIGLSKTPSAYSKRNDMVEWLKENKIPYTEAMMKHELIEIINEHRKSQETCKIDQLIEEHGHNILKLPPYMNELNPFELAWALVRLKIREKDPMSTLSCHDLEIVTRNAISEIAPDAWENFCAHVEKFEQECWTKDALLEETMENLALGIQSSDSDDSSNDSNDNSNSSYDNTCSEDL